MTMIKEINGNLIKLALSGEFDVIAHGVNCFSTQKSGLAPQMNKAFFTAHDELYRLERAMYRGDINKLGQIEANQVFVAKNKFKTIVKSVVDGGSKHFINKGYEIVVPGLSVVNCYTQFMYGKNHLDGVEAPLDYEALALCMRKINYDFRGKHIGLPLIGCGLAGGDWNKVKSIIEKELADMQVTIVHYKK